MKARLSLNDNGIFRTKIVNIPSTQSPGDYFEELKEKLFKISSVVPIFMEVLEGELKDFVYMQLGNHTEWNPEQADFHALHKIEIPSCWKVLYPDFWNKHFSDNPESENGKELVIEDMFITYFEELWHLCYETDPKIFVDLVVNKLGLNYHADDGFEDFKGETVGENNETTLGHYSIQFLDWCNDLLLGQTNAKVDEYYQIATEAIQKAAGIPIPTEGENPSMLPQVATEFVQAWTNVLMGYNAEVDQMSETGNIDFENNFSIKYPLKFSFDEINVNGWLETITGQNINPNYNEHVMPIENPMANLVKAWQKLSDYAFTHGIDLSPDYPFNESFDELLPKVKDWVKSYAEGVGARVPEFADEVAQQQKLEEANYALTDGDIDNLYGILTEETKQKIARSDVDDDAREEVQNVMTGMLRTMFPNIYSDDFFDNTFNASYPKLVDKCVLQYRKVVEYSEFGAIQQDVDNLSKLILQALTIGDAKEYARGYFRGKFDMELIKDYAEEFESFLGEFVGHINSKLKPFDVDVNFDDVEAEELQSVDKLKAFVEYHAEKAKEDDDYDEDSELQNQAGLAIIDYFGGPTDDEETWMLRATPNEIWDYMLKIIIPRLERGDYDTGGHDNQKALESLAQEFKYLDIDEFTNDMSNEYSELREGVERVFSPEEYTDEKLDGITKEVMNLITVLKNHDALGKGDTVYTNFLTMDGYSQEYVDFINEAKKRFPEFLNTQKERKDLAGLDNYVWEYMAQNHPDYDVTEDFFENNFAEELGIEIFADGELSEQEYDAEKLSKVFENTNTDLYEQVVAEYNAGGNWSDEVYTKTHGWLVSQGVDEDVVSDNIYDFMDFVGQHDEDNETDPVIKFLKWVASDYQLDENSEDYLGFINIDGDNIDDDDLVTGFKTFLLNSKNYKTEMKNLGIHLEEKPSFDESIFYKSGPVVASEPESYEEKLENELGKALQGMSTDLLQALIDGEMDFENQLHLEMENRS